jgi:hypothetical protein
LKGRNDVLKLVTLDKYLPTLVEGILMLSIQGRHMPGLSSVNHQEMEG